MSHGQKTFLMWVAIILFVAYLGGINVGHEISNFSHSVQTIHDQNTHP